MSDVQYFQVRLAKVLFQEETCDGSTFQEFCTEGVETQSRWSKTCSFPRTIRCVCVVVVVVVVVTVVVDVDVVFVVIIVLVVV